MLPLDGDCMSSGDAVSKLSLPLLLYVDLPLALTLVLLLPVAAGNDGANKKVQRTTSNQCLHVAVD